MRRPISSAGASIAIRLLLVVGLLGAMFTVGSATPLVANPTASAQAPADPGDRRVDLESIGELPVRSRWGVDRQDPTALHDFENYVWDFTQIGRRMFVAGSFLDVVRGDGSRVTRPYIAAFDIYTGEWIPTFAPQLNGAVFALAVSPSGSLLAGGQFTAAGGLPDTAGIVALDPVTGRVDTRFETSLALPGSSKPALVRALEVVGDDLYLGGSFTRVVDGAGRRNRVWRLARVDAVDGAFDPSWRPRVEGGGVWGLAIDRARNRIHAGGFFLSVNGDAASATLASVDLGSGALVPRQAPLQENVVVSSHPRWVYDVEYSKGRVYAGGEEHVLQVLDGATRDRIGFHTTGLRGNTFRPYPGIYAGGDFQVIERVGGLVFAGCHCTFETRSTASYSGPTWYDSFSNERKPIRLVGAIDANTGMVADWSPDLADSEEGVWAIEADTLGCLWFGGEFGRAGVEAGAAFVLANIARFCPAGAPIGPDLVDPGPASGLRVGIEGGDVALAWQPGTDDKVVAEYVVQRDGVDIAVVSGTGYVDRHPRAGTHRYRVVAVDGAGNRSAPTPHALVEVRARCIEVTDSGGPRTVIGLDRTTNVRVSRGVLRVDGRLCGSPTVSVLFDAGSLTTARLAIDAGSTWSRGGTTTLRLDRLPVGVRVIVDGSAGSDDVRLRRASTGPTLSFGDGPGSLLVRFGRVARDVVVDLRAGDDRYRATTAASALRLIVGGGSGDDRLTGGPGADPLEGGPGRDLLRGNGGADVFGTRDGQVDRVVGGSGNDSCRCDADDSVRL